MNTNRLVKVLLGGSGFHGYCNALYDLAGFGTNHVGTHYLVAAAIYK